jgi:Transmembrane domain of unknown function (DUF3566)
MGDEQDVQPSGIMAPPRRSPEKPAAAKSAPVKAAPPDDATSDGTPAAGHSANGAPAAGTKDASANGGTDAWSNGSPATAKDAARPAAVDATIADGVPALPADTIGASRGTKAKGPEPERETSASKADEQSPAGESPAFSFRTPPFAPATVAADPAESAAKPTGDDAAATAPSRPASSRTAPSGTGFSGAASSGPASSGTAPAGRPSSGTPAAPADPPSVSPAAFAWEMPDPPPNSPSSPARTFLRSGTSTKDSPAPKAAAPADPGKTGTGKAAAGESPVTLRNTGQKAPKGQSKRTARQAHLTIARVEPWSVMKFSFVVSLVAFVILFVAVSLLYGILSGLGVFDSLQRVVASVTSSQGSAGVNAKAWFSASKVLGYTALLGSLNIVLITAMSTIGSVVYNLTSRLVGGVEVTLRETE